MSNPTRKPTAIISRTTKRLRTTSAHVRPASTADLAIGNERKRSTRPLARSSDRPMAVFIAPKATVWTKIPGIRKSTYSIGPTFTAPPKTYRNVSTKISGWIVENTMTAGTRVIARRFRQVIVIASARARPRPDGSRVGAVGDRVVVVMSGPG